jgi:hypothetical protein
MPKADASPISLDSQISLYPLSKQLENGVALIGRGDQFLELPPEGLDFVAWLNEGLSLAQARERFEARYNPFPDEEVIEVIHAFLDCDFIATVDGQPVVPRRAPLRSNADWIPQRWIQAMFSKPVLIGWMVIVVLAVILWMITPELWPRRADYFWTEHYSIVVLTAMLVWLLGMPLHESAHWLACRAKGIEATITWTQRLGFFPMSQTIMHNIWAVPRRARFLPLAAGMAWDLFTLSIALYLLFFETTGVLTLSLPATKWLKFYVLLITMALTSQFWLFAKMDGYFLLSALLGQRNLQADTYHWLKSKVIKARAFAPPARGMKFIYIYALMTVLWGGLFMGQFLFIDLPIKLQLIWQALLKITGGTKAAPMDFADGVAVFSSQVIYYGLLIYAYWRDTFSGWHRT